MLVMFKVNNYMSFKDTTIINMKTISYIQHPTHCTTINNIKLLKTIKIKVWISLKRTKLLVLWQILKYYILIKRIATRL